MTVVVLVFTEGDYEEAYTLGSAEYARGFCQGFAAGAGKYGAGSAAAYLMPEDAEDMRSAQAAAEVAKALAAAAQIVDAAERGEG